jgi:hypothetical protein
MRVVDPTNGHAYSLTASDVLQMAKTQHDQEPSHDHVAHVTQQCGRRAG